MNQYMCTWCTPACVVGPSAGQYKHMLSQHGCLLSPPAFSEETFLPTCHTTTVHPAKPTSSRTLRKHCSTKAYRGQGTYRKAGLLRSARISLRNRSASFARSQKPLLRSVEETKIRKGLGIHRPQDLRLRRRQQICHKCLPKPRSAGFWIGDRPY